MIICIEKTGSKCYDISWSSYFYGASIMRQHLIYEDSYILKFPALNPTYFNKAGRGM